MLEKMRKIRRYKLIDEIINIILTTECELVDNNSLKLAIKTISE